MRTVISIILIFAAVLSLSIFTSISLDNSSKLLSKDLSAISAEISLDNWAQASDKMKKFEQDWNKVNYWWPMVMDHLEIDHIEFNLARTQEYISAQNSDLALGELSLLKKIIDHIPENDRLNLKNIL